MKSIKNISKKTISCTHPRAGTVTVQPGESVSLRNIAASDLCAQYLGQLVPDEPGVQPSFQEVKKKDLKVETSIVEKPKYFGTKFK